MTCITKDGVFERQMIYLYTRIFGCFKDGKPAARRRLEFMTI